MLRSTTTKSSHIRFCDPTEVKWKILGALHGSFASFFEEKILKNVKIRFSLEFAGISDEFTAHHKTQSIVVKSHDTSEHINFCHKIHFTNILIRYELSNFDHVLGVVSQAKVSGGNSTRINWLRKIQWNIFPFVIHSSNQ